MMLSLTQAGRQRATQVNVSGSKATLLAELNESGPSTIEELSQSLRVPPATILSIARDLISSGFIRREE